MSYLTIYEAIPQITGAVAPIAKERKNAAQGYAFRGIDDVYATLNLLLAKHGVSILPRVTEQLRESFTTPKGTQMFSVRLHVAYLLAAADGSRIECDVWGEAMDSGDKATQKALSMAYKYMAFQVFCIPTGEKIDTEEDSPEVAAAVPKPTAAEQAAACASFRKEFEMAPDSEAIDLISARVKTAHSEGRLSDQGRKELLDARAARVKALVKS